MNSHFTLTLDTTPPIIQVFAPTYTAVGVDTDIFIEGNEELLPYQNIRIVDSIGRERVETFYFDGDSSFHGILNFHGYPSGIATLYVRLKDSVGNDSDIITKTINILGESETLQVDAYDSQREINIAELPFIPIKCKEGIYPLSIWEKSNQLTLEEEEIAEIKAEEKPVRRG